MEIDQLKNIISQYKKQLFEVWHERQTVVKPRYVQLEVELRQKREELSRKQSLVRMNDVDFYNNCGVFLDRLPANFPLSGNRPVAK